MTEDLEHEGAMAAVRAMTASHTSNARTQPSRERWPELIEKGNDHAND